MAKLRDNNPSLASDKEHVFRASKPLEFVAMDIVGLFIKTTQGCQCIRVNYDRLSKLARANKGLREQSCPLQISFLNIVFSLKSSRSCLRTYNRTRIVKKLLSGMCPFIAVRNLRTIAFYAQPSGQAKEKIRVSSFDFDATSKFITRAEIHFYDQPRLYTTHKHTDRHTKPHSDFSLVDINRN